MKLAEERLIQATPSAVWNAILDPEVLKGCVPGCEEMNGSLVDGMEAVVTQRVGPVKATFKGKVNFINVVEGQSITISGEGQGGVAGFAKGGADVVLEPQGDATLLKYTVDASVGGKLAQLGSRIIDSFAAKMANQFFEEFQSIVEGGSVAPAAPVKSGGFIAWLLGLFGKRA